MPFNVTAFQLDAFQSGAFQQEVSTEYWAFQVCAFQWDAFQVEDYAECNEPIIANTSGGAGRSKTRRERKQRQFIEEDGKILVFDSPAEAAQYLSAQKISLVGATKKPKRAIKKARAIPKPQVIEPEAIQTFYEEKDDKESLRQLQEALLKRDIETLLMIQFKMQQMIEEEDLLILLLAA